MNQRDSRTKINAENKVRLFSLFLLFVLTLLIFVFRLVQYQYIDRGVIGKRAEEQLVRNIPFAAMRGKILDRNGEILAFSRKSYSVEIEHDEFEVRRDLLEKIVEAYPEADMDDMVRRMQTSDYKYVKVLEDIPSEVAEVLENLEPRFIGVVTGFKRIYPGNELAASILGNISTDGFGVSGVEEKFNKELSGEDGYIETRTDLYGRRNPFAEAKEKKPVDGNDIMLTVDAVLQHMAYNIAREEREKLDSNDVIVVIQSTKTGEILAMTSSYSFDANDPYTINDETLKNQYKMAKNDEERSAILLKMWQNPAVSFSYEPGSTMKILTAGACLEEGIVTEHSPFHCSGITHVDGAPIRCVSYPGSHGDMDFKHSFLYSCNVAFSEAAMMLGKDRFYTYMEKFGLLGSLGIDLPMAASSVYIPREDVYNVDFAKMSFGHAFTLTPLHVINLANVVANNGELVNSNIVKKVGTKVANPIKKTRVVSENTAKTLKNFMEGVSENYAMYLSVDGYRSGAKTGTTEKYVDGEYSDKHIVSSIVQLSPIDNPEICVLVIVDEPDPELISASTAGRIASRISLETLQHLKVAPLTTSAGDFITCPDFIGYTRSEAIHNAEVAGVELEIKMPADEEEEGYVVISQSPAAGSLMTNDKKVELFLGKKETDE